MSFYSSSRISRQQILDLKYHAQQLNDHANVSYYAAGNHDKTWHEAEALDAMRKIMAIGKEVGL
jgi:hypothetical protein